jgi:ABC-type antimicrobial peptide transport system permease subunit
MLEPAGMRVADEGVSTVFAGLVTTNYFSPLGVAPALGRTFGAADGEAPGSSPVAVLSHAFWMRRFEGDGSVIGRVIRINDAPVGLLLAASRFGTPALDLPVFAGAAVLFAAVGLTASYVPVRRATRVNAIETLRYE